MSWVSIKNLKKDPDQRGKDRGQKKALLPKASAQGGKKRKDNLRHPKVRLIYTRISSKKKTSSFGWVVTCLD